MPNHYGGLKVSSWDYHPGLSKYKLHLNVVISIFVESEYRKTGSDAKIVNSNKVGLTNLGATCYINSLLQQFFMMPDLRSKILSLPPNLTSDSDGLLYQLQLLFAYLQVSHCDVMFSELRFLL